MVLILYIILIGIFVLVFYLLTIIKNNKIMEKVNVAKMLKYCPKDMELDCTMFDNVTLIHVDVIDLFDFPIKVRTGDGSILTLTKYGQFTSSDSAKCVIFPKGKTTWEEFVPPCKFKEGDIIFVKAKSGVKLISIYKNETSYLFYDHCSVSLDTGTLYLDTTQGLIRKNDISIRRLATKEEKEKLFQTIKENGYKWNNETKTLEKISKLVFKDGDIVATEKGLFIGIIKIENGMQQGAYVAINAINNLSINISYYCFNRLATEEEKQKLFDAIKKNGYRWNAEKKELIKLIFKVGDRVKHEKCYLSGVVTEIDDMCYKIKYDSGAVNFANIEFQDDWELVPNKFNINVLKPFDKVLVRQKNYDTWHIGFFEKYDKSLGGYPFVCMYYTKYVQCIPYEQNKHLVNTTNDCDEYYKTWK